MKHATITVALALATLTATAHAITLAPGETAIPVAQTPNGNLADVTYGDGFLAMTGGDLNFPNVSPDGRFNTRAYRDTINQNLEFATNLRFDAPLPINTVSLSGYHGVSVDAAFAPATTFAPTSVSRSADGDTITFHFTDPPPFATFLNPAVTFLTIRTDSTTYTEAPLRITFVSDNLIDNYTLVSNATSPRPALSSAPVPELSTLSLLTVAATSLALRFRRRLR